MKIKINYELLETIKDSKTGLSLKRDIKMIMAHSAISSTVSCIILNKKTIEGIVFVTLQNIAFHTIYRYFMRKILSPFYKELAQRKTTELVNALHSLHIITDEDLLLESYEYKTTYKLYLNKNFIPRLKQNKYIMVPTKNTYNNEVSLLQEHIIGTNEYELSKEEPKKVLKFNKAYSKI